MEKRKPNGLKKGVCLVITAGLSVLLWSGCARQLIREDNIAAVTQIDDNPSSDFGPVVSPDGKRVVFTSMRSGSAELWLANIDDRGRIEPLQRQLTSGFRNSADTFPTWSPDGNRIAFVSNRTGTDNIWVLSVADRAVASSSLTQLTNFPYGASAPAWSPKGDKIAFHAPDANGTIQIWTMNPDGTGLKRLGAGMSPSWSPDAGRVAYSRNSNENNWLGLGSWFFKNFDIWLMSADGINEEQFTTSEAQEFLPVWAPDGRKIAYTVAYKLYPFFVSFRTNEENPKVIGDFYKSVQRVERAGTRTFIVENGGDWWVHWWVLFWWWRASVEFEIWVKDIEGGAETQLTTLPRNYRVNVFPTWSPDSREIIFSSNRSSNGNLDAWRMTLSTAGVAGATPGGTTEGGL